MCLGEKARVEASHASELHIDRSIDRIQQVGARVTSHPQRDHNGLLLRGTQLVIPAAGQVDRYCS